MYGIPTFLWFRGIHVAQGRYDCDMNVAKPYWDGCFQKRKQTPEHDSVISVVLDVRPDVLNDDRGGDRPRV